MIINLRKNVYHSKNIGGITNSKKVFEIFSIKYTLLYNTFLIENYTNLEKFTIPKKITCVKNIAHLERRFGQ